MKNAELHSKKKKMAHIKSGSLTAHTKKPRGIITVQKDKVFYQDDITEEFETVFGLPLALPTNPAVDYGLF